MDWATASQSEFGPADLEREAAAGASYDPLPAPASQPKNYEAWKKSFSTWTYGSTKLELLRSAAPPLVSQPGETEGQFRVRLQQAARESRDQAVDRLRQQYSPKLSICACRPVAHPNNPPKTMPIQCRRMRNK